jgi:hypothetical protein
MKRVLIGAFAIAGLAAPAAARTVNYGHSDAQFRSDAEAIGAPAPGPTPERGQLDVVLEGAERLDHRLVVLGISCSAWGVDNPLSQMVRRSLSQWDVDGSLEIPVDRPVLRVSIANASSDMRCVEVRELDMSCIVRTRIRGEVRFERPGSEPVIEPLVIDDQQLQEKPGACGSLSRGTGLSGLAASHALVTRLQEVAAAR